MTGYIRGIQFILAAMQNSPSKKKEERKGDVVKTKETKTYWQCSVSSSWCNKKIPYNDDDTTVSKAFNNASLLIFKIHPPFFTLGFGGF